MRSLSLGLLMGGLHARQLEIQDATQPHWVMRTLVCVVVVVESVPASPPYAQGSA
jgi:hypothetical protein